MTAVAEKVRSALARELKRDPATITPEQALREDLGLNSLDAIELMFKVEEEFDLEIPDADLQRLRTVGDLVSYLEERLGGATAPAPPVPPKPVATTPVPPEPVADAGAAPARPKPSAKSRGRASAGNTRPPKRSRA
jgi:acyl carrier protein